MADDDCGLCDQLRNCNAHLNKRDWQQLIAKLLCNIEENGIPTGSAVEAVATIGRDVESTSGTVAAGKESATFTNTGNATGSVLGEDLAAGASVTFTAYLDPTSNEFKRLPAIAYDGTGTVIEISWVD